MTDNNTDYGKLVFKKANNVSIFSVSDNLNDEWDVEGYNNLILKFVLFDKNNNAQKYIPVYVDADELRAVLNQIILGTFKDRNFGGTQPGQYISYGGSKDKGLAKKRNGQKMETMINGTEARLLKIWYNKEKNQYTIRGEVYNGKIQYGGAISKNGEIVDALYYVFSEKDAITMATSIVKYLDAKQTISLSNYARNKSRKESA